MADEPDPVTAPAADWISEEAPSTTATTAPEVVASAAEDGLAAVVGLVTGAEARAKGCGASTVEGTTAPAAGDAAAAAASRATPAAALTAFARFA